MSTPSSWSISGWDHCHACGRSQNRFHFYYAEQFEANHANKLDIKCLFCDSEINTYHESVDGPFCRPDDWKIPTAAELEDKIVDFNSKSGLSLAIEHFKCKSDDYMNRPTKN